MAEHTLNAEDMALNKLGDIEARPRKALRPIDMNHYATKKSAAQSMLDVALLMANSSQLKTVLYVGPQYRVYVPLIVLLSLSIALQVIVGLLLVFIVLINIFITALGFQGHTISSPASPVPSVPERPLCPLT
ncbi:ninjurin-1-like isoform X2 [Pelmatolapia mariae]|uniref:ninjurin-1-like isoform X2 n=1 Tax=Pelmatolapia mariae TaxID=158779 RepID=UPI002FE59F5D